MVPRTLKKDPNCPELLGEPSVVEMAAIFLGSAVPACESPAGVACGQTTLSKRRGWWGRSVDPLLRFPPFGSNSAPGDFQRQKHHPC